jgi:hygromycin-B 7''-O-kinase
MKKSYSQRLGEIEDKSFQAALEKFELGDLVSAEAIPHGLFGQNVLLHTTKGEFVFRGCPHGPGQFAHERFMAERLQAETSVPVPWPYLVDASSDIFGWPYAIMPRMPGLQLESPGERAALTDDDRLGIAEAMGELLREMQGLRHPHCGSFESAPNRIAPLHAPYIPPWVQDKASATVDSGADAAASPEAVFQKWITSKIRWYLHDAVEANDEATGRVTTPGDLQWVETVIQDHQHALLEPFRPCFVMDDFKEGNTVVTKMEGKWKVTGVFDFGTAYFGDGEADLSRLLLMYGLADPEGSERAHAFLKAYFRGHTAEPLRPGFLERARLYVLVDSAVFWRCFRKLGNYDKFPDFRAWLEPQLSAIHKNLAGIVQSIFKG